MDQDEKEDAAQVLQKSAAELLANIRETCRTSQKAIDCLVAGVDKLFNHVLDVVKEHLEQSCSDHDGYLTLLDVTSAVNSLKEQSVFEGIGTPKKMESYLRRESGGRKVILEQVVLKWKTVVSKGIPRSVPHKFGYFVPFLNQLEQLLNIPEILEMVDNPLPKEPGRYRTVLDGAFYSKHPVVQEHGRQTLAISMHVDDVEVCDPLKSKAGENSLRLFYWVLNNIHPKKRSTLKAINLLAIVKAKVAKKYGNDHFLKDFIEIIILLGTEGVVLTINGTKRRFYAVLVFVSADNPASSNLGRFKETHSALRPCRSCMVKSDCMCQKFFEDFSLLRQLAEHEKHVKKVEEFQQGKKAAKNQVVVQHVYEGDVDDPIEGDQMDVDDEVVAEKYLDHANPSVNYGVNGRSILSSAPGFDVTKCLPQDLLHLLSEGVVEVVCRQVLKDVCIAPPHVKGTKKIKPLMDLDVVNDIIQNVCDFGHLSNSKPSIIDEGHLKGSKLKQSASQMLVLLYILPFIISKVYPRKKFEVVLKLIELVNHCLQYEISRVGIKELQLKIEDFGNSFVKAFPNVKTLKLHCIVHLATQARLFGPPRQQACYRFEAMHSKFTSLATVIRNMKNYALSAATRHLAARNNEIMKGKEDGTYLYDGDSFTSRAAVLLEALPERSVLLEKFPDLNDTSTIEQAKVFTQHCNKWHEGVAFLLDQENISFGSISGVYLVEGEVVFTYYKYVTNFEPRLGAYQILKCEEQLHAILFSDLKHQFPVVRFGFNFEKEDAIAYLLLRNTVVSY